MLNIYERMFSIINPKLYHSPYKKNIEEVWDVLKNFKVRSRLLFLNNMRTLKIEEVYNDMEPGELEELANYKPLENQIHIFSDIENNLNHELFHTSSRGFHGFTGVMNVDGGDELTEGITEYLALKSMDKTTTISAYEENVFVIEFLSFIYGEDFINFYLQNRVNAFYRFFGNDGSLINQLDSYLKKIQINKEYQSNRRLYLLVTDIAPGMIEDDIDFLLNLQLNRSSDFKIKKILMEDYDKYCRKIDLFKEEYVNGSLDEEYVYHDLKKEGVLQFYIKDYCKQQKMIFEQLLDILIELAEKQQITKTSIQLFLERNLQNKTNEFQTLYGDLFLEKCEYSFRKR